MFLHGEARARLFVADQPGVKFLGDSFAGLWQLSWESPGPGWECYAEIERPNWSQRLYHKSGASRMLAELRDLLEGRVTYWQARLEYCLSDGTFNIPSLIECACRLQEVRTILEMIRSDAYLKDQTRTLPNAGLPTTTD